MYYTYIKHFAQHANTNEDILYIDGVVFSTIVAVIAVFIVCALSFAG